MIKEDLKGTHAGIRLLHLLLGPAQLKQLQELAADEEGWVAGRQGSGYFKLNLRDYVVNNHTHNTAWLRRIVQGCRYVLNEYAKVEGPPTLYPWDAYLLYYPVGSHVPYHRDLVPEGQRHHRLNASVISPVEGGDFLLEGSEIPIGIPKGCGLIFSPSEVSHGVREISKGHRLVLSVGTITPA